MWYPMIAKRERHPKEEVPGRVKSCPGCPLLNERARRVYPRTGAIQLTRFCGGFGQRQHAVLIGRFSTSQGSVGSAF